MWRKASRASLIARVGLVAVMALTSVRAADEVEAIGRTVTMELAAREYDKVVARF